ncbi:MAG: GNAT family N-acetyltransferase [Flavobacterium sp.]|nr:MAG: GNAT family N-acetyltransferase [Flavobacterium sp.]
MEIKELTTIDEMLACFEVMQHLYPKLTPERYRELLSDMLPNHYRQIAVFENGTCVGLSGYWFGTKLWSGKFIELDNFIVHPDHRSNGIGKLICDYANELAIQRGCTNIVLDAYTHNFPAHRFYYNQGFGPKGFHFVKILDEEGLT